MADNQQALVHILDSLPQSNTSPVSTPTCPEYRCACGQTIKGYHVERAEFAGKVYQEAGWVFEPMCPECKFNSRPKTIIIPHVVDPQRIEEKLIHTLSQVFGGERPAREYKMGNFQADLLNKDAVDFANAFQGQENLYLWGPCGVGKTHLSCAMIRECVRGGLEAIAMKPPKLSRYLRVKEAIVQEDRIYELAKADILLIDELGIGKETEFALQILQEVLDMRADNYKTGLIVTSNYSLEDFALKIGEDAIPSRLRKMCRIIKIDGADRRLKK